MTDGTKGWRRMPAPGPRRLPSAVSWRPQPWLVVVLVGVMGIAVALALGAPERLCTATVAVLTAAVLLSPRGPLPDRPLAWRLFAAAAFLVLVGAVVGPTESVGPVEIAATSAGGLAFLAGTFALGFRRDAHQSGASLIDSCALGVSAGAVLWAVVALRSGHGPAVVLTAIELAFDVAVLAQVRILNASRRSSTTVLRLLSVALVIGVGHDVIDVLARTGLLEVAPAAQTALATAPFVLLIAAAIDPSRAALGPGLAATRAFAVRRVVIVGLAVLVAPALSLVALRQGDVAVLATLVVVNLGVVVLVLARMAGLVARLRSQAARLAVSVDTDLLTGLESDRRFMARLDDVLASAGGSPRHVLAMSLTGLAVLNDTLGRSVGDAVIVAAASVIRQEAPATATVARTGAGEFAVLLGPGSGQDEVDAFAYRLRALLDEPLAVRGLQIPATVVVGIAELAADCADGAAVLHRCGHAVAAARESHTGVAWYGPDIAEGAALTAELMGELGEAIAAGQLVVHYQPQVDLVSGHVVGVEALVRWRHPTRGLLAPGIFIPAAERTGSMRLLTLVVLDQAVAQCAAWVEEGRDLTVAVNLSAVNLVDPCLVDDVRAILHTYGFPAHRLELEITETAAMVDPVFSASVLTGLVELGVGLAVDDYGTGYGSLAYLQVLPVSRLKIDRSFVSLIDSDPVSAAIVRSTIELAHEVGLGVVAEGVEDDEVLRVLRSMGCDAAQGYGIGRPSSAADAATEFDRIEAARVAPSVPHQGRR